MSTVVGRSLGKALHEEGLLPPNCTLVEVRIPASGPLEIVYTTWIAEEDLPKLARAMVKAGERKLPPPKADAPAFRPTSLDVIGTDGCKASTETRT